MDGDTAFAVAELCAVYQELTGKAATHSNKGENLAYEPEPRSPAGRFVVAVFKLICPEISGSTLSHAMRACIESLPAAKK